MSETYVRTSDDQTVVDKNLFASLLKRRDHGNALAKESANRRYHEDPEMKHDIISFHILRKKQVGKGPCTDNNNRVCDRFKFSCIQ